MYERSIEIEPRYSALANLGTLLSHDGEYKEAANMYRRAVALNDRDHELWSIYASVLHLQHDGMLTEESRSAFKRAAELAEAVLEVNPSDMKAMTRLARGYARLGRSEDARRMLGLAEEHGWADVFDIASAATTHEILGSRERALELFELAVARGWSASELSKSPDLRGLREDPRFRKLTSQ